MEGELAEEAPSSVTVQAEPPPASHVPEVTAVAAGAALNESGHASEAAAEAEQRAALASEEAEAAAAAAAAATQEAESAHAAAATTEGKLDRLVSMMTPLYEDYAARRAAEMQKPEVTEVDATSTGTGHDTGTGHTDHGPERDEPAAAPRRPGLRRLRK